MRKFHLGEGVEELMDPDIFPNNWKKKYNVFSDTISTPVICLL
jgi:hypothetical protein